MHSRLRWRVTAIAVVLFVCSGVGVYPILAAHYHIRSPSWLLDKQLKLGLDLQGGVHIVLRVEADVALRLETEQDMERLREALATRAVMVKALTTPDAVHIRVEGVQPDQDSAFRQAAGEVLPTFDRGSGSNGSYVFTMKPDIQVARRREAVVQARETIERRINALGVTEPTIARQGQNGDQILVQLPGVTNDRAKDIIRAEGVLELKLVERGPSPTRESLMQDGPVPSEMEIVPGTAAGAASEPSYYLLHRVAAVTGRDLRNARPSIDENNQPAVSFTLKSEGGRRFSKLTSENMGRQLAIVLDGHVHSAPRIDNRITTDGNIHGNFTQQEAQDLALVLRSGALPAPLTYLEEQTIGPTLGSDSIRDGVAASIVGLMLVIGFMLAYYKWSGVNAIVALLFNLVIELGLLAYIGEVMTLPGIAGFVLTMGIGVDSNVLIFERIKEELEAQRGVRAAIHAGFNRVLKTLIDTHVAALISCALLFQFGTGPIRGFAVTLFIGLVSNLFTSTFVSKTLFELALTRRRQVATLSI
jgi:preprotein translocase subunit SecD